MDQEKITKLIKENKWLLRQLIFVNNEIKELRGRVLKLEKTDEKFKTPIEMFNRRAIEIPVEIMSDKEIANIKVGGTDPD